jgi:outer membrane receptor protein involved in Fe transport
VPINLGKYNGVLRWSRSGAGWGFNVTGMAYKADWTATDQIPRRAVDTRQIGRFGSLDPTDGGSTQRYSLSSEWRREGAGYLDTASLYAIRSRFNLFSNFTYALDDPVYGDQFEQAERRDTYGGQAARAWQTAWGGRDMANTLGVQVRRDRLNPVALYSTVGRERLAVTREDRVTQTTLAPFASSAIAWTPWLRSVAGIRADHYRFSVDADIPANAGSRSDAIVSPKLTLVFGPWAHTEYFVNYGRGFHSNDARGTTISVDPRTLQQVERVRPLVRSEGYEAGARTQLGRTLLASIALWRLDMDSELLFVGDAGTTEPSRPSRRTGVELLAQYLPSRWLAFDATVAFTRARFTNADPAGDYIPGAPDRVASAGMTVTAPGGWFGAVRWRYFGPRPLVEDGTVRSPSTSLVNARLGYQVRGNVRAFVDVFNLFDRKDDDIAYFYTSQLRGEAGPVDDVHFHPVEPRSVRVSLAASF